ncbi:MAG TPA: T9SS type A sorting domain-containing protein, partial [Candidatus Eisenbacteria bacterium]|nr:T9SS type A sorting domain-containing protein [Candidatus Eisenbacteria bacterium]
TVSPGYEITGIILDAYETAIYGFGSPTGVESGEGLPPGAGIRLGQNFPNPFNPSTTIAFDLPRRSRVNLSIYDVQGRPVRTVSDGILPEGRREVVWDGRDEQGNVVSSGVYFYRLTSGDHSLTRKMVLLK